MYKQLRYNRVFISASVRALLQNITHPVCKTLRGLTVRMYLPSGYDSRQDVPSPLKRASLSKCIRHFIYPCAYLCTYKYNDRTYKYLPLLAPYHGKLLAMIAAGFVSQYWVSRLQCFLPEVWEFAKQGSEMLATTRRSRVRGGRRSYKVLRRVSSQVRLMIRSKKP